MWFSPNPSGTHGIWTYMLFCSCPVSFPKKNFLLTFSHVLHLPKEAKVLDIEPKKPSVFQQFSCRTVFRNALFWKPIAEKVFFFLLWKTPTFSFTGQHQNDIVLACLDFSVSYWGSCKWKWTAIFLDLQLLTLHTHLSPSSGSQMTLNKETEQLKHFLLLKSKQPENLLAIETHEKGNIKAIFHI